MALYSLSLCAGIGGLDLSVELACPGIFTPAAMVEGEGYAAAILAARMADKALASCPFWADVRTVCDAEFRDYVRERTGGQGIDFVYGGIPCQPHSVAGKQLGAEDERDLWPATVRILETFKPWLFFLENVPGMLGYVSSRAVPDLQRLGYIVPRPVLLEAAAVGSPQKRERLFILAYLANPEGGMPRRVIEQGRIDPAAQRVADTISKCRERRGDTGDVAGESGPTEGEARQRERSGDTTNDSCQAVAKPPGGGLVIDMQSDGNATRDTADEFEFNFIDGRGAVDAVDDTNGIGSQGQLEAGTEEGAVIRASGNVPYWPPGPAQRNEWQRILAVRPDLAPAIESGVRDDFNGNAARLGSTRTDELRSLGNMVVPVQGAFAFLVLLERLKEALTTKNK